MDLSADGTLEAADACLNGWSPAAHVAPGKDLQPGGMEDYFSLGHCPSPIFWGLGASLKNCKIPEP